MLLSLSVLSYVVEYLHQAPETVISTFNKYKENHCKTKKPLSQLPSQPQVNKKLGMLMLTTGSTRL